MRHVIGWGIGIAVAVIALGSCGALGGQQPQAAAPVINNIMPSSDSGTGVILVFVICALIAVVIVGAITFIAWYLERTKRRSAEGILRDITQREMVELDAMSYRARHDLAMRILDENRRDRDRVQLPAIETRSV